MSNKGGEVRQSLIDRGLRDPDTLKLTDKGHSEATALMARLKRQVSIDPEREKPKAVRWNAQR